MLTIIGSNDIVILSSQMNTCKTAELILKLNMLGITSVFTFDHWTNYSKHFTLPNRKLVFPSNIFVMDEYAKSKLIECGASNKIIKIVGHPGIESIEESAKEISDARKVWLKKRISHTDTEKVILLALEPLSIDFRNEDLEYDEYDITSQVVNSINKINQKTHLVIRLHPRQDRDKFSRYLYKKNIDHKVTLCPKEINEAESILISDVVIGITSVFLIKALFLNKPIISMNFNRRDLRENRNIIPYLEENRITDPAILPDTLNKKLSHNEESKVSIPINGKENIWIELKNLINLFPLR